MKHHALRKLFIGLTPPLNVAGLLRRTLHLKPSDFLPDFTARFPKVFDIYRRIGIHPELPPNSFIDPFTQHEVTESFANIGYHGLAVGYVASTITTRLVQSGVLSPPEADKIIERALLHDIVKPYCALTARALKSGLIDEKIFYGPGRHEIVIDALRLRGFTAREARALVLDYGAETDPRQFLPQLLTLRNDELGLRVGLLAGKIVFLADCMTCSPTPAPGDTDTLCDRAHISTTWERLSLSQSQVKYPTAWHAGLGLTSRGRFSHLDSVENGFVGSVMPLASYHHLMIWSAREICLEICRLSGLSATPASAERTIVSLVGAFASSQARTTKKTGQAT